MIERTMTIYRNWKTWQMVLF